MRRLIRLAAARYRVVVHGGLHRDAGTGAPAWSKTYQSALGRPVVAGGVLYATVDGAFVDVLNAETGAGLDPFATFDDAVGHPVVVNGWLYVTSGRLLDAYTL